MVSFNLFRWIINRLDFQRLHYITLSFLGLSLVLPVLYSTERDRPFVLALDIEFFAGNYLAALRFLTDSTNDDFGFMLIVIQFLLGLLEILVIPLLLLAIFNIYANLKNIESITEKMTALRARLTEERLEDIGIFRFVLRWVKHKILFVYHSPVYRAYTFSILAIIGITAYRDRRNLAYWRVKDSFPELGYNTVTFSIGYYLLILGIIFIYILSKVDPSLTTKDIEKYVKEKRESFTHKIRGPITLQYVTIHLLSLTFMYVTFAIQFGIERIWFAPTFYLELILTYGLNFQVEVAPFFKVFSMIFAPILVISVGWVLFFLKTSGFAKNGPPLEQIAPQEPRFLSGRNEYRIWGYFAEEVPLAETYLGDNPKLNGFYLLVVFLPVIGGIIISSVINTYVYKNPRRKLDFFNYVKLMMGISFFSSIMMAIFKNSVVVLPTMMFRTLFATRDKNFFVLYDLNTNGTYHPLSTFWILLIHMTAIVTFAVLTDSFVRNVLTGKMFEEKESQQLIGRTISKSKERIPFTK